jgi:hypothetical protein
MADSETYALPPEPGTMVMAKAFSIHKEVFTFCYFLF